MRRRNLALRLREIERAIPEPMPMSIQEMAKYFVTLADVEAGTAYAYSPANDPNPIDEWLRTASPEEKEAYLVENKEKYVESVKIMARRRYYK